MNDIARRNWVATSCVAAMLLLTTSSVAAQDAVELEEWQQQELESLIDVIAAAKDGQLVAQDNPFSLDASFLKGADGVTEVPFTLTIDASKVSASTVGLFLFVEEHVEATPTADDEEEEEDEFDSSNRPADLAAYSAQLVGVGVFRDADYFDVTADGAEPIYISHFFSAPGGTYDVYVAIRDSTGGSEDDASTSTVLLLREELEVPDFWTPQLDMSSILVTDVIEPMVQPLTAEQLHQYPYSFGTLRIVPKLDRSFGKQEELAIIFFVYNAGLKDATKPDVTIEYDFHQQTADGEEFFNKTNPQQFNPETLPPDFDVTQGYQIIGGQTIPLTLFPAGDYRLAIKVTDNTSGAELLREVVFTVRET